MFASSCAFGIMSMTRPCSIDVVAVRHRRGEAEILLDQQDREPFGLQAPDRGADLLDDDRGEALGRLVEKQQARAGAQDAPDRQHLLLAARTASCPGSTAVP